MAKQTKVISPLKKKKPKVKTARARASVKLPKQTQTKTRGLSSELVHLSSEIKRINQRIVELEKRGFTGTPAYNLIVVAKYGKENIITEKKGGKKTPTSPQGTKGGGLKIRTDVKNMTPEEIKAVEKLIKEFTKTPSTITEIKKEKQKVVNYYKQVDPKEELTMADITDDELKQYLDDVNAISADAIAKAFYLENEGFSDLYYRSVAGEKYEDLKQEAINALIHLRRTEGFSGDNEPYDEDIINLFYRGGYDGI